MRRKIKYLLLSACCTLSNIVVAENNDFNRYLPSNWQILAKVTGDLNNDGQVDIALLIQPKQPENQQRKLLILLKQKQTYKIAETKIIPLWTYADTTNCSADVLGQDSLSIKNNILSLNFESMNTCSNWYGTMSSYHFRLQQNQFKLIGYDYEFSNKNNGDTKSYSLNYATNKMKITIGSFFPDSNKETRIIWKTMPHLKSFTLQTLPLLEDDQFLNQILKDNQIIIDDE